ncbi:hypothetical protein H7R52_12400 [Weissella confusa]|uniref:Uncharacterized protein n=1 Tax=Weissella confusa TaxID=1583 RepID=A0A923NIH2_WEICO|nr:hypothetical protein [Weissella confusa]
MLGKPNEQEDDTSASPTTRVAIWRNGNKTKTVTLTFAKTAFAFALFALWLDRHGDKTLPIITALLSLLGIGLVSINQNYYGNSISHESKHLSVHINDKQADGFDCIHVLKN